MELIHELLNEYGLHIILSLNLMVIVLILSNKFFYNRYKNNKILLSDVQDELDHKIKDREQFIISNQAEISKLKNKLTSLSKNHYITEFKADEVYVLIAKSQIRHKKQEHNFGLVQTIENAVIPYLCQQSLQDLHPGDQFSMVGGKISGIVQLQDGNNAQLKKSKTDDGTLPFLETMFNGDKTPPKTSVDDATIMSDADQTMMASIIPSLEKDNEYYKSLPYLKIISGNDIDTIFHLHFTESTIGRDDINTIMLDDTQSSRTNSIIRYQDNYFVIENNESTNGTFHNGKEIENAKLNFGDIVKIGETEMVFSSIGFDLREKNPEKAIHSFECCLKKESNFIIALKNLAFLLERDVRRKKESHPIWERVSRLEKRKKK